MRRLRPRHSFLLLLSLAAFSPLWGENEAIRLFNQALAAEAEGKREYASELYKASLRENPRYREPYLHLADLNFREGAAEEALVYADAGLELARELVDLRILRGRILTRLGRFREAEGVLSEILEKQPYNIELFRALAELELARGSLRLALAWYDRALEIDPNNRTALLSKIPVQDALDMEDTSSRMVVQLSERFPESYDVHMIAASHYRNSGYLEQALGHCEMALRIAPKRRDAILLYAQIQADLGNYRPLADRMKEEQGDLVLPEDYLYLYLKAAAEAETGAYEEALDDLEAVLRIKPDDQLSRIVYERLLADFADLDQEKNRMRIEQTVAYHLEQAEREIEKNRFQEAGEAIRRALNIDPRSRGARALYAELWRLRGYPAKQLAILQVLAAQGDESQRTADLIEIYEHELGESVSRRWGVDQFSRERFRFRIPVYVSRQGSSLLHPLSEEALSDFTAHMMLSYETLAVPDSGAVDSFAQAYGKARRHQAHYFAVLSLHEEEDAFSLRSELFSGESGTLIRQQRIYRTGNRRISDALGLWVQRTAGNLPLLGNLIDYSDDRGLFDLGRLHGVEKDAEFLILPDDKLEISKASLGLRFSREDAVGTLQVDSLDEMVSAGSVASGRFYDLINPGDWLVPAPKDDETDEKIQQKTDEDLVLYQDIYKSVSNIR